MSDPAPQFPPPTMDYATPGSAPPRSLFRSLFGWVLFIGLAIMLFLVLNNKQRTSTPVSLSEFSEQLARGNIKVVIVENEILRGQYFRPVAGVAAFQTEVPQGASQSWTFVQWLLEHREGAEIRVENNQNLLVNLLLPLVPWVLIFGFIWFFVFRQLRRSSTQVSQPRPIPVYITTPEPK
jgi:cell division protease FtsH